ncbi:ribosome maturation factor RimM [Sulfuricurvum sp.]|uniref:ribosome maturation factor RimM n=1 Tax=Sulfuricurvum sp. TaxID=2025608 RepID=UPI002638B14E|nr:ribosome maturation factor RimM [Sulfuricurvum sp.]MDD2265344.1 ribosome maturation factor RimM [Sulfuricurvum sp.]MDD2783264.1 ribosome maturation factor RimM [Sulfuricurvum sp.]
MSNRFRNSPPQDLLHVATLGRVVGLKGDMRLNLSTDFPEQFSANTTFLLENGKEVTLTSYNPDRELVHLKGIDTPEAAKALTNAKLFTTFEATRERCNLKEGEFFWFDLLGCRVVEDESVLGKVQEIERIGPLDYLLVATDPSFVSKGLPNTFLIPYIDRFVLNADAAAKVITVEGGLDLLEAS